MHQSWSVPAAPSPPSPSGCPPAISILFCLEWQIPGDRDSWAGMGTQKEGKRPVLRQLAQSNSAI